MTEHTQYELTYQIGKGKRITEYITGYEAYKARQSEILKMPGDKTIRVTKDGEKV